MKIKKSEVVKVIAYDDETELGFEEKILAVKKSMAEVDDVFITILDRIENEHSSPKYERTVEKQRTILRKMEKTLDKMEKDTSGIVADIESFDEEW